MISITNALESALLGAVEGLTEFLPVSSTGHLILASDMIGFNDPSGTFDVVIQMGAILAVCLVYFHKLWGVLMGAIKGDKGARRFIVAVLLAFLPAVVAGVLLHDFIKHVLFSPFVVAVSLIVGGIVMLLAEHFYRRAPHTHAPEDFTPALSLKIGLAQCLALIPGVSRSGATIIGALLLGVERRCAAEFSFFLAIPTMAGAVTFDLLKSHASLTGDSIVSIIIGFVVAFIVALLVIRWFIGFVGSHDFKPFGWYRIIFGIIILCWLHFHGIAA